jgi:hypothetical protein
MGFIVREAFADANFRSVIVPLTKTIPNKDLTADLNDRMFEALSTIQEFRASEKASRTVKPVPNNFTRYYTNDVKSPPFETFRPLLVIFARH